MMPPRSALFVYDAGADDRERSIEQSRRARLLRERPPRPHLTPCACDECRRWAQDIVTAPAPPPAGGGA